MRALRAPPLILLRLRVLPVHRRLLRVAADDVRQPDLVRHESIARLAHRVALLVRVLQGLAREEVLRVDVGVEGVLDRGVVEQPSGLGAHLAREAAHPGG